MSFDANTETYWRIVLPNGEDWDQGDGVPHFESERDAQGQLEESPSGTKAVQFNTPCVLITCDGCEVDPGAGDVFTKLHSHDLEEARKVALASDWTVTSDDKTYCWDCPVPDAPTEETETDE